MRKTKPNRKQREARRALHAQIYQEGFEKGWELRERLCTCSPDTHELLKLNIQNETRHVLSE